MIYVLPYPNRQSESFITAIDTDAYFLYLVEEPKKIYKKDITLDYNELNTDEPIVIVGAEVLKHLFRTSGITKYAGTHQTFFSKELNKDLTVGLIPDIKILETYPYKKNEFIQYLVNIANARKKEYYVEFHYPEHEYIPFSVMLEMLKDAESIVIDLECSSLFPHKGDILGVVFAASSKQSFYIPWKDIDPVQLENFLKNKTIIGHNLKFDLKYLKYNEVDLTKPEIKIHDTMFLSYLSNENDTNKLKDLAIKYTPFGAYDRTLEVEKKKLCKMYGVKVRDFTYDMFPSEILGEYACYDGVATYMIYERYKDKSYANSMIYNVLLQATKEFALLELNGCYIDKKHLHEIEKNAKKEIITYKNLMYKEIADVLNINEEDVDINLNSPKQLSNLLFNIFGYEPVKKTDTGQNSTDAEVLNTLVKEQNYISNFAEYLLKYRKANKYFTTYIQSIINNLDYDGYIRSSFNLIGTVSGRLSSGKDSEVEYKSSRDGTINFQNIPSRDKQIKKLFIPEDKDWEVLSLDLKNAELWMVGYLAKEPAIMNAFKNNQDIHSATAKLIFKEELKDTPVELIKEKFPSYRQKAKTINFAILYLAGPNKIANELKISKKEAENLIKTWFDAFPNVRKWLQQAKAEAENYGQVTTIFGRVRISMEVFSSNKYLASHYVKSLVNSLIQSPTSDINLIGYCKGIRQIREKGLRYKAFALVHDSIVGVCHKNDREKITKIFIDNIQNILEVDPPIGVDVEAGPSWGELYEVAV